MLYLGAPGLGTPCCWSSEVRGLTEMQHNVRHRCHVRVSHLLTSFLSVFAIIESHGTKRDWNITDVIMESGMTISSTNCDSSPRTACLFLSRWFIATDCCCNVCISELMLLRSVWKPFSICSILYTHTHTHTYIDTYTAEDSYTTSLRSVDVNYIPPHHRR